MASILQNTSNSHYMALLGFATVAIIALAASSAVYRLYLHPLRKIPGPRTNALSRVPYVRHLLAGTTAKNTVDLHTRYGDVVRLSPNEVSCISIDTAFQDIYGFRTGKLKGHLNMQKDPVWYAPPPNGKPSILIANDEAHTRGRRLLSHAFSEKALSEQEVLLQQYVDQLIGGLKEASKKGPQDMTKWFNWTTFDIIADLLFGEPFGCLRDGETHGYIDLLLRALEGFRFYYIMHYFPVVKYFGSLIVDKNVIARRIEFYQWVARQTKKRVERDTQRPDFMTYILNHRKDGSGLSDAELNSNAVLFITAGSETTATTLSGLTYLLLQNPKALRRVTEEVRARFTSGEQITISAVQELPYLKATIAEGLRHFPPVPTGFERKVPAGGEVVSGYYLPEGTSVSVAHWAAYHSERNFKNANAFVPERWMGDPTYENDKREWCQPFSFGPRNCLGKNLAYAELRLILAKLLWTFDLELAPSSANWMERCKVKTLWVKPELSVYLTEVVRKADD